MAGEQEHPEAGSIESGARRFANLAAGCVGCVMAIVVLLMPRHPTSVLAWLAYLLALSFLVGTFYGLAQIVSLLESRARHRLAARCVGFVVAVVPGLTLLYLLFSHADFVMRYFQ